MKFAKALEGDIFEDRVHHYSQYNSMQQVLEELSQSASPLFSEVFEKELAKVHAFTLKQLTAIAQDVRLLELRTFELTDKAFASGSSLSAASRTIPGSCIDEGDFMAPLQEIKHLCSYVMLNHKACDQIAEKFKDRFGTRLGEHAPSLPTPAERFWLGPSEIDAWLLRPAEHCLRLLGDSGVSVDTGSLRRLSFWIQELAAGCRLSAHRMKGGIAPGGGGTLPRIQLCNLAEDGGLHVKNTFLTCYARSETESPRRASSQPPMVSSTSDLSSESSFMAIPGDDPEAMSGDMTEDAEKPSSRGPRVRGRRNSRRVAEVPRATPELLGKTDIPGESSAPAAWPACGEQQAPTEDVATRPSVRRMEGAPRPTQSAQGFYGVTSEAALTAPTPFRWWTEVSEVCPLSGFPINLLPYPPFKYQVRKAGSKESVHLIDGLFLVLQVLASWHFEALGRDLTSNDIEALDLYVKRCKLGPFRLGRAVQMQKAPEMKGELEALRAKASRRFEDVRQIQRVRLARSRQETEAKETKCALPLTRSRRGGRPRSGHGPGRQVHIPPASPVADDDGNTGNGPQMIAIAPLTTVASTTQEGASMCSSEVAFTW
eukprot:CAMPEP_0170608262 /NCGR_PEP_ID=MMETSP0224-20130122/21493_1 /TAXON_ID=285029 /ORGANISM="Togula jolla, Strain CCCM 725" /LENGTH=598 /DNA_ID=CAMNT_0010933481 /DNA_START=30 /DNA_END=1823 /DNA_ORIENTATION=+